MSQSHQEYLLKKYLSGGKSDNPSKTKKPKRKDGHSSSGESRKKRNTVLIDEDNDVNWSLHTFEDDEDAPYCVPSDAAKAQFLTGKKSNWTVIKGDENEQIDKAEEEETKQESEPEEDNRMISGARTGLQSGKQVAADIRRQEILIRKKLQQMKPEEMGKDAETVYRDSKGRKLDMKLEKEKEQAKVLELEALEKARIERNKGIAQKEMAQQKKEELEKLSTQAFSRYADDAEMNSELKARSRWEDPSANYLSENKQKTKYPKYQGPSGPGNRYNIAPGYRWDGVDRSNGYEKELLVKVNTKKAQAAESYAWSTEDM